MPRTRSSGTANRSEDDDTSSNQDSGSPVDEAETNGRRTTRSKTQADNVSLVDALLSLGQIPDVAPVNREKTVVNPPVKTEKKRGRPRKNREAVDRNTSVTEIDTTRNDADNLDSTTTQSRTKRPGTSNKKRSAKSNDDVTSPRMTSRQQVLFLKKITQDDEEEKHDDSDSYYNDLPPAAPVRHHIHHIGVMDSDEEETDNDVAGSSSTMDEGAVYFKDEVAESDDESMKYEDEQKTMPRVEIKDLLTSTVAPVKTKSKRGRKKKVKKEEPVEEEIETEEKEHDNEKPPSPKPKRRRQRKPSIQPAADVKEEKILEVSVPPPSPDQPVEEIEDVKKPVAPIRETKMAIQTYWLHCTRVMMRCRGELMGSYDVFHQKEAKAENNISLDTLVRTFGVDPLDINKRISLDHLKLLSTDLLQMLYIEPAGEAERKKLLNLYQVLEKENMAGIVLLEDGCILLFLPRKCHLAGKIDSDKKYVAALFYRGEKGEEYARPQEPHYEYDMRGSYPYDQAINFPQFASSVHQQQIAHHDVYRPEPTQQFDVPLPPPPSISAFGPPSLPPQQQPGTEGMVNLLTSKLNMSQEQLAQLLNDVLAKAPNQVNTQQQQLMQSLTNALAQPEQPPPPQSEMSSLPGLGPTPPPPPMPMYPPNMYDPRIQYGMNMLHEMQPPVNPPPIPMMTDNRPHKRSFSAMDRSTENDAKRPRYSPPKDPRTRNDQYRPQSPFRGRHEPGNAQQFRNRPNVTRHLILTFAKDEIIPDQRYLFNEWNRHGRVDDMQLKIKDRLAYVTFKNAEDAERAKYRMGNSRLYSTIEFCDNVEEHYAHIRPVDNRNGVAPLNNDIIPHHIVRDYVDDGGSSPPPTPPPPYLIGI
jgi:hypothetical protein